MQKNELGLAEKGMVHPQLSGEFVARMEDRWTFITKSNRERPVVCFDETSKARGCAASH